MIEAEGLTKRYGDQLAVDGLTFTVKPGLITGFLGPNGAGKSTTMRMVLGLDFPTSGSVTVNGKPFAQHQRPLAEVGALLEARAVHTGRSARNHLLAMAATTPIFTSSVMRYSCILPGAARWPTGPAASRVSGPAGRLATSARRRSRPSGLRSSSCTAVTNQAQTMRPATTM